MIGLFVSIALMTGACLWLALSDGWLAVRMGVFMMSLLAACCWEIEVVQVSAQSRIYFARLSLDYFFSNLRYRGGMSAWMLAVLLGLRSLGVRIQRRVRGASTAEGQRRSL